jgi:hypothetical protein
MIDCVEGGGQVKKDESGYFPAVTSEENVIRNAQKSSLGGMEFTIGRLEWRE